MDVHELPQAVALSRFREPIGNTRHEIKSASTGTDAEASLPR